MRAFAFAISISVLGGCGRGTHVSEDSGAPILPATTVSSSPATAPAASVLTPMGPLSFAPIAKAADPAVVLIQTTVDQENGPRRRGGHGEPPRGLGTGTGFVVDADGLIVTNNHVIDAADHVLVRFATGRVLDGAIIGRDGLTDLAVLRVKAETLPTIRMGDSDAVEVGDWVVAIGNPFGLDHTVSAGIVSAKGRSRDDVPILMEGYVDFIQTDASINPGNSGGPLLNLRGEVIGVNTAIRGGNAQGIGFAIPVNMLRELLPLLLKDGKVVRSAIGVLVKDIRVSPLDDRTKNGWVDGQGKPLMQGVAVDAVESKGPGGKAGIQAGDVIVAFEGEPIRREIDLRWRASLRGVGKVARVSLMRKGKPIDVSVTMAELPVPATPRPPMH